MRRLHWDIQDKELLNLGSIPRVHSCQESLKCLATGQGESHIPYKEPRNLKKPRKSWKSRLFSP